MVKKFIVKQNSGEAIADALNKLIKLSPTEYVTSQTCCRQWVHSLNWKTVVEQHLELYQQ